MRLVSMPGIEDKARELGRNQFLRIKLEYLSREVLRGFAYESSVDFSFPHPALPSIHVSALMSKVNLIDRDTKRVSYSLTVYAGRYSEMLSPAEWQNEVRNSRDLAPGTRPWKPESPKDRQRGKEATRKKPNAIHAPRPCPYRS